MRTYHNQPSGTVSRARDLRRNATEAEKKLWRALREAFPSARFRRQVPIGRYFADFFSFSARLIIEVDGGQHAEALSYDAQRTRFLEAQGYRVLRFWNNDVLENTEGVLTLISLSLQERASGWPSPRHGLNSAGRCSPDAGAAKRRKGEDDLASTPSPSPSRAARGPLPLPAGEGTNGAD